MTASQVPEARRLAYARVWAPIRASPFFLIWPATGLLFAFSPLIAAGSLSGSALLSMLPFASIVAIASVGQTLVVQQGGLDLSAPGVISLSTIIVTQYPNGSGARLPVAILLGLLASMAAGLVNGIAITRFAVTPIVATLGVNALLTGVVLELSGGSEPGMVPGGLSHFAAAQALGVPNTVWTALAIVLIVAVVSRRTAFGRRLSLVGENARAAKAAAIAVTRYRIGAYVFASVTYGIAGVLLAGFLQSPGLFAGDQYLLPTIVAVVLGGTSLSGGKSSIVATAIGALFLTQLQQIILGAAGENPSTQFLIEGAIIALGMAFRHVSVRQLLATVIGHRRRPNNGSRPGHTATLQSPQ